MNLAPCPVPALPIERYRPVFPCYLWKADTEGIPPMWLRLPDCQAADERVKDGSCTHWLPIDADPQVGLALPGGADVAEMRGLLVRCFEHLGREINRKSLTDSALDGTQVLSRQVAELLDRTGVVVSTPDDLDSKTDAEINGLFAVEVAGLVRTESGAFRSKPGAATIAFVTPDMLDYCEIAEEVLPFAHSWRSLHSPGDGYSVTVYGGPGQATARNLSFPRALAVALIRLARLPR